MGAAALPLRLEVGDHVGAIERVGQAREAHRGTGRESPGIGEPGVQPLRRPAATDALQRGGIAEAPADPGDRRADDAGQGRAVAVGRAAATGVTGGAARELALAGGDAGDAQQRGKIGGRSGGGAAGGAIVVRTRGEQQARRQPERTRRHALAGLFTFVRYGPTMNHKILVLALSGAIAVTGMPIPPATSIPAYAAQRRLMASRGVQQQAYFARRLTLVAERLDRQRRAGLIAAGPAAFMRDDLTRIWIGMDRYVQRGAALTPDERRSYCAMLRRVEQRLARAETRQHAVLRLASRSVGEQ